MVRLHEEAALPEPQLVKEVVERVPASLECCQVLVYVGLCGAREASPHTRLHEPEEQLVSGRRIEGSREAFEEANHDRNAVAAEQDTIMVESQPSFDQVQACVDVLLGTVKGCSDVVSRLVVKELELGLTGKYRVDGP